MKYIKTYENIRKYNDINGLPIELHDFVMMPDPDDSDHWNYGDFEAMVIEFDGKYIIVEDSDEDCFSILPNRVINTETQWYEDEGYKEKGIDYETAKKMKDDMEKYNL